MSSSKSTYLLWFVAPGTDLKDSSQYDELTSGQDPAMTIEVDPNNWGSSRRTKARRIQFHGDYWRIDFGNLEMFLNEAEAIWSDLKDVYLSKNEDVTIWFEYLEGKKLESWGDGRVYLLSKYKGFRIWLINMVLRSYPSTGPSFIEPQIQYVEVQKPYYSQGIH